MYFVLCCVGNKLYLTLSKWIYISKCALFCHATELRFRLNRSSSIVVYYISESDRPTRHDVSKMNLFAIAILDIQNKTSMNLIMDSEKKRLYDMIIVVPTIKVNE